MCASFAATRTLIPLEDVAAQDPRLAGHKAATLARLTAAGFPVPHGFVITSEACDRIVEAAATADGLRPVSMAGAAIPPDLLDDLSTAAATLTDGWTYAVAVRSSSISEDLPGASFAGQYETVLGVRGADALTDAVRTCLGSAFSPRVLAYARRMDGRAPMAVLVQEMVPAEAAGVAFTANPVTGDRETLVSAVRGLGERLVGGQATPDEWVVRAGSAISVAMPEHAIDETSVREVADLAARVETALGGPQDIEWAMAGDEVRLLQARPITALPVKPDLRPPESGSWMKDDAHYATPLTPFGASVYLPALDKGMVAMGEEWGLLFERVEQISLGGEAYLRMVPVGGKESGGGKAPPAWLIWLATRLVPALRSRAHAADAAIRSDLADHLVDRWNGEWRGAFLAEAKSLRARNLTALSDKELGRHLDEVIGLLVRGEVVHFRLFAPYMLRTYELAMACQDVLGWSELDTISLLTGTSEASSAPGRELDTLAATIADRPEARAVLDGDGGSLLDRMDGVAPDIAAEIRTFLDEHGHRTLGYDPGEPTLFERPEFLAGLLRDRVSRGEPAARPDGTGRATTVARARDALAGRSAADRERFERALTAAERVYPVREDNIAIVDNAPAALLRYAMLEFGRRLADRGVILVPEYAAFLTVDELRQAMSGGTGELHDHIARRRAERAWVAAHPGPATYGPEPGPSPDLGPLPAALRLIMSALMWTMGTMTQPKASAAEGQVSGVPGSPGRRTGPVRIIAEESQFGRLRPGDVLVCPITSPSWSVLFSQAGAVVTDGGGVLAHAAVIAREYGIPAVLATKNGTRQLREGQLVTVDGSAGTVTPA